MRIINLSAQSDSLLLEKLSGFPTDLPDLRGLRPPGGNGRSEGIAESWAARAQQATLPALY